MLPGSARQPVFFQSDGGGGGASRLRFPRQSSGTRQFRFVLTMRCNSDPDLNHEATLAGKHPDQSENTDDNTGEQ
jgi:hypothetical protein